MQTIIYKKRHKKKIVSKTQEYVGNIYFGYFGLKAMTTGVLTAKQIETARRVISRMTKRSGKVYIRVFFHHPLTKKPSLSRMGKGVGAIKLWISYVKSGSILLEVNNIFSQVAIAALRSASLRLPIKTIVVSRKVWNY